MTLLDEGAISHTGTNEKRYILFSDLIAYKNKRDDISRAAINELAVQGQALRMDYE
ncbi:hypothetical protein [Pseudomonas sp. RtIB026]|uniref:hypothetical protein n=1 Tax=Pseudomonas sp. RtIB026 TaxID=2749999 RepID=UPI002B4BB886|nr:hypothetical protein [Pseudomonas sp. RtIB026]